MEILKKEGNYNAKLQYDSDVVMYPIANFYRLSIDDESETEYTANVSSSSSVINSLPTDSDTVDSKFQKKIINYYFILYKNNTIYTYIFDFYYLRK